ncbi:MAG: MBL fold metallo-hydrolase [Phycisphaerales bacterium]|nr:MBL fold metallo-hydrolase [Phycisphaerales bacterium]
MSQRLHIRTITDPAFAENCYVLWLDGASQAWIVDPGFPPTPQEVESLLDQAGLTAAAIVLTHCHVDHIAGVDPLRAALPGVPLIAPRAEADMLESPMGNLSAALGASISTAPAEQWLAPGDRLTMAGEDWRVLDVSGHSPGGLAFYSALHEVVISGDALFAGSVGRTDFPGSSSTRLLRNIREHLLTLPDETTVLSGHGPPTTIGRERKSNPFVQPGATW